MGDLQVQVVGEGEKQSRAQRLSAKGMGGRDPCGHSELGAQRRGMVFSPVRYELDDFRLALETHCGHPHRRSRPACSSGCTVWAEIQRGALTRWDQPGWEDPSVRPDFPKLLQVKSPHGQKLPTSGNHR